MLKQAALALVFTLLPAAAFAQEHSHGQSANKASHAHAHGAKPEAHVNPVALILEKRAELKLTEEQVAKLEDASVMMQQHHAQMAKPGAKVSEADHEKMHQALMSIFSPEQAVKVKQIMDDHEKCEDGKQDQQCTVNAKKKVQQLQ